MNILALSSSYPKSNSDGTSPYVKELYEHLAQKGHTVHIVLPHYPGGIKYELRNGVHLHYFRYGFDRWETLCYSSGIPEKIKKYWKYRFMFILFFWSQLYKSLRIIKKHNVDIISSHWLLSGISGFVLKKLFKIPLIITIYGVEIFLSQKSKILNQICSFLFSKVSSIVTISQANVDMFRSLWGKQHRLLLIPVGPQTAIFNENVNFLSMKQYKPLSREEKISLLFVGRLVERKGVIFLIQAVERIRSILPKIKLKIVGDGPERSNLKKIVTRLRLQGAVEFSGYIDAEELAELYNTSDIFILPSIVDSKGDTEGLGIVTLEAWAYGLPVIASRIGGIVDTVIHQKTGLLVEPEHSDAIAKSVIELVDHPELTRILVQNGQAALRERYNWDYITDSYIKEFEYLLKNA